MEKKIFKAILILKEKPERRVIRHLLPKKPSSVLSEDGSTAHDWSKPDSNSGRRSAAEQCGVTSKKREGTVLTTEIKPRQPGFYRKP